jgi:glycosyltransferase involved in cell wall biosynthesis
MYKLLFVVHRYAPYPGGSEYNTHRLAKEAVRQGHDVLVLSDTHQGDFEGVAVTSDRRVVRDMKFDMIIVHGSCPTQDFVHGEYNLPSPVYYMLLEPPKNVVAREYGTRNATWIGYGTSQDYRYIESLPIDIQSKAVPYVYGIPHDAIGTAGRIKELVGVKTEYMAMAAGGYWPHKRFHDIVTAFNAVNHPKWSLVLFGYDTQYGTVPSHGNERVIPVVDAEPSDIYDAMADADVVIMNSESEGYGLTLLEAMYNKAYWWSTPVAAGEDLHQLGFGHTLNSQDSLHMAFAFDRRSPSPVYLERAKRYVQTHHMIEHSLASILAVL